MSDRNKTKSDLLKEIDELQIRLSEAEDTLRAIKSGEVDAIVVNVPEGDQVYTLTGAERPYRIIVETMHEGAVTLSNEGIILYANTSFAGMLNLPLEKIVSATFCDFVSERDRKLFSELLERGLKESLKVKMTLTTNEKKSIPAYISLNPLRIGKNSGLSMIITDLSEIMEAESFANTIFDQAVEAIIVCDEKGFVMRANQAARSLCGIANPCAQKFEAVFPIQQSRENKVNQKPPFSVSSLLNGETFKNVEVECKCENGDLFFVLNAGLLKNIQSEKLGCIISLTDITVQKKAEELLRMSESKYRMLVENLPQRIFYKDRNSVYVSCNENYARDLHIMPDEIKGKTDYDFHPREIAEKYRADDRRIMESGKMEDIEEQYINDGQELMIHTVKTPIKNEKGEVIGILGSFLDITEKVALENEAMRSSQLVSLGELAAGVAHEINNPITGVINYAQILVNKAKKGNDERDILERIIKEGDRIANIVHSLLSFARPVERNEKKSAVQIKEIVSDVLILAEAQLRKDGINLFVNIPPDLPDITANPQQIEQVFLNLISNARYALNQKYPGIHDNKILEILGEEITMDNRPHVKVTFYDRGTGISAKIRNKVLCPFFTTKPKGIGTGLGLSVSYGIIKDHHGTILIDSVESEFARISVVLPVSKNR